MHSAVVRPLLPLLLSFLLLLPGCRQREPILIGFIGPLTGHHSDIGIYGRNGVAFAVDEINKIGGIHGRPVQLIIRDGKQDAALTRAIHKKMIDQGVAAIIGPMTSSMAMAVVSQSNSAGIVTISPTAATNKLTGLDDYFFRTISPSRNAILRLAEYSHDTLSLRRISVVWDSANEAFSKEWLDIFQEYFSDEDDHIISVSFTPNAHPSFSSLATTIIDQKPDGVLLVASSLDAAQICQQLRKQGSQAKFISTMWAMTEDFLQHAGSAADGTTFSHWFNKDYGGENFRTFQISFQDRFHVPPNFASHFAYESAQVIFTALQHNEKPKQLKETIETLGEFQGTQGKIHFDQYGDPNRKVYLLTVVDGALSPVKE